MNVSSVQNRDHLAVTAGYAAVRETGAGVIDLSSRGRIRVSGTEAIMFLNGLITNDMKTLAEQTWMPAVFPTVQGRLIAATRVIRLKDEQTPKGPVPVFLLDTEPETRDLVLKTIERFTMAGDFRVTDLASSTRLFSVQGKHTASVIDTVFGPVMNELGRGVAEVSYQNQPELLIRATHTSEDGVDLIVPAEHGNEIWDLLVEAGAIPFGTETLEILRIEAGIARHGTDMDETNVVTETNLDEAVSFTKGCYVGQEIIVRIKHRGHVAKKLTGFLLEDRVEISSGARILHDQKEIGRVTSVTFSPLLGKTIALGYVRFEYLSPGTNVVVETDDRSANAIVHEPPFVRGSWYD